MKTPFNISKSTLLFTCLFLFMSLGTTLSGQRAKLESRSSNDRIPMIKASVKVTNNCKSGYSCGNWLASIKKVNSIEITNLSTNWYPSLTFEIYDCTKSTTTSQCPLIDVFTCSDPVVTFASSSLVNGGLTTIILKDPNSNNSAMYSVTNGSFNGHVCGYGSSTKTKSKHK